MRARKSDFYKMFLSKNLSFILVTVLFISFLVESAVVKRSEDLFDKSSSSSDPTSEICVGSTPCGWAVYNKANRVIDYFLENKCVCEEEKKCIRDGDDLSIAAYVYHCNAHQV